jgi:FeS assembly protein IscX
MHLGWKDADAIGYWLARFDLSVDPLNLNPEAVLEYLKAVPDFSGDLDECTEEALEAIRLAWYDAYRDLREP